MKHRILRDQPEQKFLLYRDALNRLNWKTGCWMFSWRTLSFEPRRLPCGWLSWIWGRHLPKSLGHTRKFFGSGKRKEALKRLLKSEDSASAIRLKMLAVCAGTEPRLDVILEALLAELADGGEERARLITRCALGDFLWKQMLRVYGYESPTPHAGFAIEAIQVLLCDGHQW